MGKKGCLTDSQESSNQVMKSLFAFQSVPGSQTWSPSSVDLVDEQLKLKDSDDSDHTDTEKPTASTLGVTQPSPDFTTGRVEEDKEEEEEEEPLILEPVEVGVGVEMEEDTPAPCGTAGTSSTTESVFRRFPHGSSDSAGPSRRAYNLGFLDHELPLYYLMEFVGICWLIKVVTIMLCKNKGAESCANGEMRVSPASIIRLGSSINISCILKESFYNECTAQQLCIIKDNTKRLMTVQISTNAVTAHIPKFENPKSSFACKLHCNTEYLICGIDIKAGNPPDQPRNLKCIQNGRDGDVSCSWDVGQVTHISTNYILWFRNESHSYIASATSAEPSTGKCTKHRKTLEHQRLGFACESGHSFDPYSVYSAWVTASNQLGYQSSAVMNFTLDEIVKPNPPNISKIEFSNSSPIISTIYWKDQQNTELFEIRYQSTNSKWEKKFVVNSTSCKVADLEHFAEYEFQVRCKFNYTQGLWSDWSPSFVSKTPEAVPIGQLDVWYTMDLSDANNPRATLLWKLLKVFESRGRILGYTVTLQKNTKKNTSNWAQQTMNTWYTVGIPRIGCTITVSAYNTKGNSPPTQLHISYFTDLPPPRNISAMYAGNKQFVIKWMEPVKQPGPVQGYVVEWTEVNGKVNLNINWMKLPPQNFSAILAEKIKPKTCFRISVYAIYESGAGRPVSTQRYSAQEAAPLSGPIIFTKQNTAVIFWKNVPEDQEEGCIESYTIYLQEENSELPPAIYRHIDRTSRNYTIPDLKPRTGYIVWMTAVTRAGEGKNGEQYRFYFNQESSPPLSDSKSIIVVVVGVTFLVAVVVSGFCLWQSVRKRIWSILSKLTSRLYVRNIPDPANCSWAKEYTVIKGKMDIRYNVFQTESASTYEDPETLQVEEMSSEQEFCSSMENVDQNQSTQLSVLLIQSTASQLHQSKELSQGGLSPGNSQANILDYKCQLPCLYIERLPSVEINQELSDSNNSIMNQNVGYIPSNFLHITDNSTETNSDIFSNSFSFMPLPSLSRMEISYGGKLTLDVVKIDCSSLVE
uniref:interleukin-12 receptor subunit beta-2 n=1 Tax=Pristiophorus japonicus TaxID=55135 RepID=UPI00398ED9F4